MYVIFDLRAGTFGYVTTIKEVSFVTGINYRRLLAEFSTSVCWAHQGYSIYKVSKF